MKGMSIIVKTITRLVVGFITIFGIYIVVYGHLTPGGGFAGGVMLACGFILMMLAFGKEFTLGLFSRGASSIADSSGALAFLALALVGYLGGSFFFNLLDTENPANFFQLFSAGIIPLCNIAIAIKVGACLFGVFIALVVFRMGHGSSHEKESN